MKPDSITSTVYLVVGVLIGALLVLALQGVQPLGAADIFRALYTVGSAVIIGYYLKGRWDEHRAEKTIIIARTQELHVLLKDIRRSATEQEDLTPPSPQLLESIRNASSYLFGLRRLMRNFNCLEGTVITRVDEAEAKMWAYREVLTGSAPHPVKSVEESRAHDKLSDAIDLIVRDVNRL